MIDDTRLLVPDRLRIAICSDRAIRGFPDIPLSTAARVIARRELIPILVLHHGHDVPIGLALRRTIDFDPFAIEKVRIGISVDVDDLMVAKVDGIGAQRPHAAVQIGVEDLMRECNPAAG